MSRSATSAQQQLRHLLRIVKPHGPTKHDDDALLQAVLLGFPDRVAQCKSGNQVMLANGRAVEIVGKPPSSQLLVALDAEDRTEKPLPQVRLFARVEPEWLLDHFPEHVLRRNRSVVESAGGARRCGEPAGLRRVSVTGIEPPAGCERRGRAAGGESAGSGNRTLRRRRDARGSCGQA